MGIKFYCRRLQNFNIFVPGKNSVIICSSSLRLAIRTGISRDLPQVTKPVPDYQLQRPLASLPTCQICGIGQFTPACPPLPMAQLPHLPLYRFSFCNICQVGRMVLSSQCSTCVGCSHCCDSKIHFFHSEFGMCLTLDVIYLPVAGCQVACGPVVIARACPHLVPVLFSVVVSTVMYLVSLLHMVDIIAVQNIFMKDFIMIWH